MKHLVLLGAGHAHVHVLARLAEMARKAPLPFKVTLVAPYPQQIYSGMLPGHVAGHYSLAQCTIALEGLLKASGVNYVRGKGTRIEAVHKGLIFDGAEPSQTLTYDILSINTGPVMDRERLEQAIPGARENALFLRPIEAFSPLWEQVLQLAQKQALRIAVIGAGAAGVELAFAMRQRLPHCSVTLVCGGPGPVPNYPPQVQRRVGRMLRQRGITVLPQSCTAISREQIVLDHVTVLPCDVPVLALGAQAPRWLSDSGLTLDERGFVAVNAHQQSLSHPQVFAAGDVAGRTDAPHPKSGVYAVRAAPALATNLLAVLQDQPLQAYTPPVRTLNLLACGTHYAIASHGGWSTEGRWVWYWKNWIDRRFMRRFGTR